LSDLAHLERTPRRDQHVRPVCAVGPSRRPCLPWSRPVTGGATTGSARPPRCVRWKRRLPIDELAVHFAAPQVHPCWPRHSLAWPWPIK